MALLDVQALVKASKYTEALDLLLSSSEILHKNDQLYLALEARIYSGIGNDELFFRVIDKFIALYPISHNPYALLYEHFCKNGDYDNAIQALRSSPLPPDLELRISMIYKSLQAEIFSASLNATTPFTDPSQCDLECAPKLAICMMVKDEEDIIYANLTHHYKLGCRRFFLLENSSTDATLAKITEFRDTHSDALCVIINDPVVGYYQENKTKALCNYAYSYCSGCMLDVEFLLILDADEFIVLPQGVGLQSLINTCFEQGTKGVVFDLCDSYFERGWSSNAECEIYNAPIKTSYRSSHVVTKNLIHYTVIDGITMGNHTLKSTDITSANIYPAIRCGGRILHFAYRGLEHTRKKIVNGGLAYIEANRLKRSNFGDHWKKAYEAYLQDADRAVSHKYQSYVDKISGEIASIPQNFHYSL